MKTRRRWLPRLAAVAVYCCVSGEVSALGSIPAKDLPSVTVLQHLPLEVRRSAERIIRSCGGETGTTSAFSRFLRSDRTSLIALHFHSSNCLDNNLVCDPTGCLHQIYVSHGNGYRLVFSRKASEIVLENVGPNLMATITIGARRFTRRF